MLLKSIITVVSFLLHISGVFTLSDNEIKQETENLLNEDTGLSNCLKNDYLDLQEECYQTSIKPLINSPISMLKTCDPKTVIRMKTLAADPNDVRAKDDFLNAVVNTNVMRNLDNYLREKRLIPSNRSLKQLLDEIWFTTFNRVKCNPGDNSNTAVSEPSSGFKHVFVGEVKKNTVCGFHSWINYFTEEDKKRLKYICYHNVPLDLGGQRKVTDIKFRWKKQGTSQPAWKNYGSIFLGTTPELEMALYTLCFYARNNQECPVKLNNKDFRILTCNRFIGNKKVINTAFPVLSGAKRECK